MTVHPHLLAYSRRRSLHTTMVVSSEETQYIITQVDYNDERHWLVVRVTRDPDDLHGPDISYAEILTESQYADLFEEFPVHVG